MCNNVVNSRWLLQKILTPMNSNIKLSKKFLATSRPCCSMAKSSEQLVLDRTTVDKDDVERHSKQMKEWWDINGPMRALHSYNLIRVPFVRDGLLYTDQHLKQIEPLKDKTILDVGCGGGILSEPLAKLGAKVTGIDASTELINCAMEHSSANTSLKNNKPTYICTSIEKHAECNSEKYDGVVASEVIEHVNNKELFVQSCLNVLKPGGRIFITTPNRTKFAEFSVIYAAENIFNMIPKGTHQIDKFITPTELTFLLERNNCHVEIVYGIFYNILTGKWALSGFQTFAYAMQAIKLTPPKQSSPK